MRPGVWLLLAALCMPGAAAGADPATYTVKDGIYIDRATYKGFLYYGDQCERCHGPEGEGGTFAPSLLDSIRRLPRAKFEATIMDGRKNMTTSVHNVMPAFRPNPDVTENLPNIYAYLKARADGALRRGHPEHLEDR
jgi:mono/diheme cytochrome c family protein